MARQGSEARHGIMRRQEAKNVLSVAMGVGLNNGSSVCAGGMDRVVVRR
jgi:hypothetical protein